MNSETQYMSLDESQPGAIRPELLAKKIADVRRLKFPDLAKYFAAHPRAVEALWSIQWMSMQPGGLARFCAELIAFIGVRLGTPTMRECNKRKYSKAECVKALSEIPHGQRGDFDCDIEDELSFTQLLKENGYTEAEAITRREAEQRLMECNEPYLRELCENGAQGEFPVFCEKICCGTLESPERWYCGDVLKEVIAFMDARAQQVNKRLAPTIVAVKVFDALDYASSERVMVRIEGESRFGKTEGVETWAASWPGRARVVRTPASSSERDLIKAVAEAFGIHQTFGSRGETLKDKVEFVIRFSGLMLIFDEGSFLLPSNFSATTAPARLNWIRTSVVDRKVPCVIVVTPQSYHGAVNRFVKKTGYSIEQFLGREALRISLPNELSREDLIAVASVHFPDADEDLLGLVAAKALQSESYLKAIENISRRARFNATKRGARNFTLRDVDKAIEEVMPKSAVNAAPSAPAAQRSSRNKTLRGSAAKAVLQAPFRRVESDFKGRENVPAEDSAESVQALATV